MLGTVLSIDLCCRYFILFFIYVKSLFFFATMQEQDDAGEPYQCREKPEEQPGLPKDKWICDHHYIHVFYDDEDKAGSSRPGY